MDNFSYTDSVRAALASCLPCLGVSASSNQHSSVTDTSHSVSSPSNTRPPASSSDLEHLLRDPDSSDVLSLHSNPGSATHRRARRRRRSKFSLTLFGYTLFGRPPIYLSDDDDEVDGGRARTRTSITASSSTLDSDAAPLDASTIERLTSPDHYASLAVQREREREQKQSEVEDEAQRKAKRRARREERKARARAEALRSLSGTASSLPGDDTFEGFQGSGAGYESISGVEPVSYNGFHQGVEVVAPRLHPERFGGDGDADDADLDGELYARKKKPSAALSASGSDSRSRTSASFSTGDASHIHTHAHFAHQSIPYPHTEMHLPAQMNKKTKKSSKRTSAVSSATSQSTSTVPYTPVESVVDSLAVAAFPIPQERCVRDGGQADFPSAGLPGSRRTKLDPRPFLTHPT